MYARTRPELRLVERTVGAEEEISQRHHHQRAEFSNHRPSFMWCVGLGHEDCDRRSLLSEQLA
jgi:hypothetical protein